MEVKLTYNRADIAEYYGEEAANAYTDDQLSVPVTDYTVSSVNTSILDSVQYIIVNVVRAGKTYHAIFPITVHSKAVTSIELENPKRIISRAIRPLIFRALRLRQITATPSPNTSPITRSTHRHLTRSFTT